LVASKNLAIVPQKLPFPTQGDADPQWVQKGCSPPAPPPLTRIVTSYDTSSGIRLTVVCLL